MEHISKVSNEQRVGQIKMEEAPRRRPSQCKSTRASKLTTMRMAQLTGGLVAIVALTISFSHHIQPTSANAALSEVWSETDGLQVKYSTNHDDLLNSKGSEISLSSDQQNQRHTEPASGSESGEGQQGSSTGQEAESGSQSNGAEESSSPSSEDSPSSTEGSSSSSQEEGEQSTDQAGGSNEQGAADSRQTEKSVLPSMAGRVQSYSSSPSSKHSSSSSLSSKSHSGNYRDVAEESSRLQKSSGRPIDSPATFESLGPSFADSSSEAPAASEEQTSADEDSNDGPLSKEGPPKGSGAMRFRQPGRLFKEAVRMTESGDKRDQANAVAEDSDESSSPSSDDKSSKSKSSSSSIGSNDNDDDDDSSNEGSWGAPVSNRQSSGKKPNQEQNMIDYERPYGTKDSSADEVVNQDNSEQMFRSAPAQGVGGTRAHNQFAMNDDEDSSDVGNSGGFREQPAAARGPMYYDHSGRALLAASSQKGQTHPFSGKLVATNPGAGSHQATDSNKQPFKQLAYFRGLNADQASGLRQPMMRLNAVANQERAPDGSPDSVRDNFISPGHYPGSMPHLTQAASEIAQSAADIQSPKSKPIVAATVTTATVQAIKPIDGDQKSSLDEINIEQRTKSSSQETNSELNNGNDNGNKLTSDISGQQQNSISSDTKTSDNVEQKQAESKEVVSIAVTPMPELQLESQQIMAPVLVSTTTIAPMASTSASPRSGQDDNKSTATTSTSTTSTTTKAPSLKRFKFRKYR